MKTYRTEIYTAFISVLLIGAVVFFVYRMDRESKEAQIDLYDLVLPEARCLLSVNQPEQFLAMLGRQPELKAWFDGVMAEDFFSLLVDVSPASALLVYYPQTLVACFPLKNTRDRLKRHFSSDPSLTVREQGFTFDFYPRDSNRYFGFYEYRGVCVAGYSRKLLQTIANVHTNNSAEPAPDLKNSKELFDKSALANGLYRADPTEEWQTFDLFMHEEQVCFLLSRSYRQESDSLIRATADSLSIQIKELISDLAVQPGYSKDDAVVYYTFCAPLQAKHGSEDYESVVGAADVRR